MACGRLFGSRLRFSLKGKGRDQQPSSPLWIPESISLRNFRSSTERLGKLSYEVLTKMSGSFMLNSFSHGCIQDGRPLPKMKVL